MVDVVRTSGKKPIAIILFLFLVSAPLFFVESVAPDDPPNGNGTPPIVTGENPVNGSVDTRTLPMLNVTVDDAEDDFLDTTWRSNFSGPWAVFAQNLNINTSNGTVNICQVNNNFTNYSTTYYWSVNVTDGSNWTNRTYHFTTRETGMGWRLLENNTVLDIWNRVNHYYFNVSNGMQFTNHYNEYWAHNVMMLGYLTPGGSITDPEDWNLIYRTDELSGFTKQLRTDNQTYINVTLWKDMSYTKGGNTYNFRLALRYHLGVDDMDLSVTPYVKNLGIPIPFVTAFGWEVRDTKIGGIEYNSSIYINQTGYLLNQTPLDEKYTNLTRVVMLWNETSQQNENVTIPDSMYTLYRAGHHQDLYLKWNSTLKYLVWVKNRTNQYNAPVTLFLKIGTLNTGQERYTTMHWLDSTLNLLPDAEGTFQQWDTTSGVDPPSHYTEVDDPVGSPNEDTDYVYTSAYQEVEDFNHATSALLAGAAITNVRVNIRAKAQFVPGNNINIGVRVGVTRYGAAADTVLTTSYVNYFKDWTTNPATSNPWTKSDIDALQSSLRQKAVGVWVRVTQVYLTVTYTPPPPDITINFAGNLSDIGGPYWRPPSEDVQLTGIYSDGYYTNDSRQSESWMYIHVTITSAVALNARELWINWLNESTWTNWRYGFSPAVGADNYYFNTTGRIKLACGYNYSFNIVANDTLGQSNTSWWNKTGIGGRYTRRWVQLNCNPVNISYTPYYYHNTTYTDSDKYKHDRLQHDQGGDGQTYDTSIILSAIPTDTEAYTWCTSATGRWFDASVCPESFSLSNIYYHIWWRTDVEDVIYRFIKSRKYAFAVEPVDPSHNTSLDVANMRSVVDSIAAGRVFLNTELWDIADVSFTDNDIYEILLSLRKDAENPATTSNRSITSFVLFNVPDNATLNASYSDSDNDLLSDWEELYGTYTNPFIQDTDNDGVSDYDETLSGSDPNDYTDTLAPDIAPPEIIINFAGNLSDSGGPYWRPPDSTQLTGVWSDGYYTNDSRQSEGWMYINCTITDATAVGNVWLNWLNETTWTNWSYQFTHMSGDYYELNTSNNFSTRAGYNYSFNIVANDTASPVNSNDTWWNKTGLGEELARRWVQLNCTQTNISYSPLYFYNASYGGVDQYKHDRLHHDQGADGTDTDTGYLLGDTPTSTVENRYCSTFIGLFFDNSTCIQPFVLNNIYYHFWWSAGDVDGDGIQELTKVGWYKQRRALNASFRDEYSTNASHNRSVVCYDGGTANDTYYLETHKLSVTATDFTDNDIYEAAVKFYSHEDLKNGDPSVISNRSFTSFILFNVPDNATLNISYSDSDSDLLSDWEELYGTYTNPFLADTDNDGINDYWENKSGSDPNNYTETFNCSITFDINRTSFAFGVVQNNTMVYSNATQPDTFRIYNNGTCSIDIDINGTNATASDVTDWNLSSSNGDNQYKMEIYNSSTGWIQINKTADTWYTNMAQSTNIAANIRITTPTVFYSGKQMTCTIYMTASIH